MDSRQQLQDVRRVVPLVRRQLETLVRHRMLPALVVWLRQDSHYGEVARVSSQDRTAGRVNRAQHRRRGEGQLQRVEDLLRGSGPRAVNGAASSA